MKALSEYAQGGVGGVWVLGCVLFGVFYLFFPLPFHTSVEATLFEYGRRTLHRGVTQEAS